MSTRPNDMKPAYIRKTVDVLLAAGLEIQRIEVERGGRFIVTTGKATPVADITSTDRTVED